MTGTYTFIGDDEHEFTGLVADDVLELVEQGALPQDAVEIDGECVIVDAGRLDAVLLARGA